MIEYRVSQEIYESVLRLLAFVWGAGQARDNMRVFSHTNPAIVLEDECEFWTLHQ